MVSNKASNNSIDLSVNRRIKGKVVSLLKNFYGTLKLSSQFEASEFELIFEGVADPSPDAVRKIKGILISDLELSITEVQHILENHPLTIRRSLDENKLLPHYMSLKDAGAQVLLLRPKSQKLNANSEINNSELQFDCEDEFNTIIIDDKIKDKTQQPMAQESTSDGLEFEIEFDNENTSVSDTSTPQPKTYELNIDGDSEQLLAELKESWGDEGEILKPTPSMILNQSEVIAPLESKKSTKLDENASEFSLEIAPPIEGIELIDSTKIPNDLDENGEWGLNTLSESLASAPKINNELELVDKDPTKSVDLSQPLLQLDNNESTSIIHSSTNITLSRDSNSTIKSSSQPLFSIDELNKSKLETTPVINTSTNINQELQTKTASSSSEIEIEEEALNLTQLNSTHEKIAIAPDPHTTLKNETPEKDKEPLKPKQSDSLKPPKAMQVVTDQIKQPTTKEVIKVSAEIEQPSIKKKTKSSLPLDILLPIAFGGLLLGIANWYYFSFQEPPRPPKNAVVPKHVLTKNEMEIAAPTITAIKMKTVSYSAKEEKEGISLTLIFDSDTNLVTNARIEITTPQPPALTPEEIVNKKMTRPWLRKIEVQDIPFEKGPDGVLIGKGSAKSYIERGDYRIRLIGNVRIAVKESAERSSAEANLEIALNFIPDQNETRSFFIEETSPNQFRYLIRSSLIASSSSLPNTEF